MKAISLTKTVPLSLIFFQDNVLEPVNFDVAFTLLTEAETASDEDLETAKLSQNVGFAKIICLLESIIDNSVVYTHDDNDKVYSIFGEVENNFITVPALNELVLAAALHSKVNSIIDENSYVSTLTITDVKSKLEFSYTLIDEEYDELPSKEEWNPLLSYWDEPWWQRNDINTFDKISATQEEYDEWNTSEHKERITELSTSMFSEIENQLQLAFNKEEDGELIHVDFQKEKKSKWQPKIID